MGAASGEDVLGDFGVNPCPPLAAAPCAGEVVGREKRQKEPGLGGPVVDAHLPVIEAANGLCVEEHLEFARGVVVGERRVLGLQCFDKRGDSPVPVVIAGVGSKEVVFGCVG